METLNLSKDVCEQCSQDHHEHHLGYDCKNPTNGGRTQCVCKEYYETEAHGMLCRHCSNGHHETHRNGHCTVGIFSDEPISEWPSKLPNGLYYEICSCRVDVKEVCVE